jgi:hypothetical protein
MTNAACANVPLVGSDATVIALTGALSTANGFSILMCGVGDDGKGNAFTKGIQSFACVAGICSLVWLIQFLVGWGDVSELCEGEKDYEELEKLHTYIIWTFIITGALCLCSCFAVASGVAGGGMARP